MAEENTQKENVYSADDPLDINELASLNDDISPEFIEQLQNQVAQNASEFTGKPIKLGSDDSELFEEVKSGEIKPLPKINIDDAIDDNFIKKYKAKLNKQEIDQAKQDDSSKKTEVKPVAEDNETNKEQEINPPNKEDISQKPSANKSVNSKKKNVPEPPKPVETEPVQDIENLTGGNIIEKPVEKEQLNYQDSLDFLDDNVKYSKYVIYIDPENTEFIESLTVKERKNLINRVLREQDDIAITKRRLGLVQTIIKHSIVAILTIAISIPVVYWTINASLEASINNYRRSQTVFQTLYKEKGKIKNQR